MIRYHFDRHGNYLGYIDERGRYFDVRGRQEGSLVSGQKLYDRQGAYRGRVDAQGNYFDELGRCRGYLRHAGRGEDGGVPFLDAGETAGRGQATRSGDGGGPVHLAERCLTRVDVSPVRGAGSLTPPGASCLVRDGVRGRPVDVAWRSSSVGPAAGRQSPAGRALTSRPKTSQIVPKENGPDRSSLAIHA